MPHLPTPPPSTERVDTLKLYQDWAETYDTDGNILQAIDDLLIPDLLQQAFFHLRPSLGITVAELGCGTGRNTIKLLDNKLRGPTIISLNALDFSEAMLEKARLRIKQTLNRQLVPDHPTKIRCVPYNALDPATSPIMPKVDLVVSSLVLEHLPLDEFFDAVKGLLKPGGVLVLTNMHQEMGEQSRAGFRDAQTGTKFQGESYAHSIDAVVECGAKNGFTVDEAYHERAISEEDLAQRFVGERGRKWIGVKVWFGLVMELKGVRRTQAESEMTRFHAKQERILYNHGLSGAEKGQDMEDGLTFAMQIIRAHCDVKYLTSESQWYQKAVANAEQAKAEADAKMNAHVEKEENGAQLEAEKARDVADENLLQAELIRDQAKVNMDEAQAVLRDYMNVTWDEILDAEFAL